MLTSRGRAAPAGAPSRRRRGAGGGGRDPGAAEDPPARPLPRGPHSLTPEQVAASQRERLFAAVIDAVAENGYVHTSVAHILRRAGVSRSTFYELFRDKEDCFVAALQAREALLAEVLEETAALVAGQCASPIERVEALLATYLDVVRSFPAEARALLIEVYAAGPRAVEQRDRALDRFVDVVAAAFGTTSGLLGDAPEQRFAARILVGGVSSMVTHLVGAGHAERLPSVHAQLVALVRRLS
jgi:AcrR family transcriptional regulator